MPPFPIISRTPQQLQNIFTPGAGSQEFYAHELFDTQTYVSGTTTQLVFFQTVDPTKTLSNMEGPGQLPSPKWFVPEWIFCDILLLPTRTSDGGVTGALNDVALLNRRSTWELKVANKSYGVFPLRTLQPRGGLAGVAATGSAAVFVYEAATNGITANSWYCGGQVALPPNQNFELILTWNAAVTLAAGDCPICIAMDGTMYRSVR